MAAREHAVGARGARGAGGAGGAVRSVLLRRSGIRRLATAACALGIGAAVGLPAGMAFAPAAGAASPTIGQAVFASSGTPSITETPDTGLSATSSTQTTITSTNWDASTDTYFVPIECNSDPSQPTYSVFGHNVPVGCSEFVVETTSKYYSNGTLTYPYSVPSGNVGSGDQGTDSAGNPASQDAAKYPCPPTPAQQQAGIICAVALVGITSSFSPGAVAVQPVEFSGQLQPTFSTSPATAYQGEQVSVSGQNWPASPVAGGSISGSMEVCNPSTGACVAAAGATATESSTGVISGTLTVPAGLPAPCSACYVQLNGSEKVTEDGLSATVSATDTAALSLEVPPPSVTSVTPASSPLAGGGTVTIEGTSLTGATAVDFGSTPATNVTVVSSSEVTATIPAASAPGRVDVTVATPNGTTATGPDDGFVYVSSGSYVAVAPYRIADTRCGMTSPPSFCAGEGIPAANQMLVAPGPGQAINVQVTGTGTGSDSVPAGAEAAVVNLTAVDPTHGGFLTVYPAGTATPVASSLNFSAGEIVANLVEVAIGSSGEISVFNAFGTTDVLVDVEGYVSAGSSGSLFNPVVPTRLADTRCSATSPPAYCSGEGIPAANAGVTAPGPASSALVTVTGVGPVPSSGVSAVVLNITAADPSANGFLTVYPAGAAKPASSTVNFVAGENVPNRVVVPVGTKGQVAVYNNSGTTNVLVDVSGWFGSGGSVLTPSAPVRICDTRPSSMSGLTDSCTGKTLTAAGTLQVAVAGVGGVPSSASAVVVNVTVTGGSAGSFLSAYPAGGSRPSTSDLNWRPGETVANLTIVKLGSSGALDFYNNAGSVNVIVDVVGWFG